MLWKCGVCEKYEVLSLRELLQHINRQHGSNPAFHVFCGIDSCPRGYATYPAFYKHVRKEHANYYESHMRLHRSRMSGVCLIFFWSVKTLIIVQYKNKKNKKLLLKYQDIVFFILIYLILLISYSYAFINFASLYFHMFCRITKWRRMFPLGYRQWAECINFIQRNESILKYMLSSQILNR